MVNLALLKSIKAFSGMSDEQLASIRTHCEELEFRKGVKLFKEGDVAAHLWHVIEGQVDLRFEMPDGRSSHPERTISSIEVKQQDAEARVLGWSCFIEPYRMRLSAYCVTDHCKIIRVPKDALTDLFEENPTMGYKFLSYMIRVVGYRFHQFQDHVAKNMGEDLMSGW